MNDKLPDSITEPVSPQKWAAKDLFPRFTPIGMVAVLYVVTFVGWLYLATSASAPSTVAAEKLFPLVQYGFFAIVGASIGGAVAAR